MLYEDIVISYHYERSSVEWTLKNGRFFFIYDGIFRSVMTSLSTRNSHVERIRKKKNTRLVWLMWRNSFRSVMTSLSMRKQVHKEYCHVKWKLYHNNIIKSTIIDWTRKTKTYVYIILNYHQSSLSSSVDVGNERFLMWHYIFISHAL